MHYVALNYGLDIATIFTKFSIHILSGFLIIPAFGFPTITLSISAEQCSVFITED